MNANLKMNWRAFENAIAEMYRKAATEIPSDVLAAMEKAEAQEQGLGKSIMRQLIKNAKLAKGKSVPICQDTGTPVFYISSSDEFPRKKIRQSIVNATRRATSEVPLRPNAIDVITGKNTGNNVGEEFPVVHFEESDSEGMDIFLILKGGGSENVGKTYSLPDTRLGADRNLEGVRKCALDFLVQAQGKGCPPGIMSICIGGTKDVAAYLAKRQLAEKLGKRNQNAELAKLEKRILKEANELGIGPMGLGGKSTLLDVKIASAARHAASYFVEISYSCWALRRSSIKISKKGVISEI